MADTITVDTTTVEAAADGACSLVEALDAANSDQPVDACPAGNGSDVIELSNATYPVTSMNHAWFGPTGLPAVQSEITVRGNGAVIDAQGSFRLFAVHGTIQAVDDLLDLVRLRSQRRRHDQAVLRVVDNETRLVGGGGGGLAVACDAGHGLPNHHGQFAGGL